MLAMFGPQNIPRNVAALLWRNKVPKDKWAARIAQWIGCSESHGREFLEGTIELTPKDIRQIAEANSLEDGDLHFEDFLRETNVIAENLRYLLDSLPHGGQKALAELLAVNPATVAKWKMGEQLPSPKHLAATRRFFGLSESIDLHQHAIFLSLIPIGAHAKRQWLLDRLQSLEEDRLNDYFPALKRLIE
jgi:hypothetical protein